MSTASWPAASSSSRMGALSGKPAWSEATTMRMGGDHTQAGRMTGRMCLHKPPTHRYSRANLRHGQGEEVVRSRWTGPTRTGARPSVASSPIVPRATFVLGGRFVHCPIPIVGSPVSTAARSSSSPQVSRSSMRSAGFSEPPKRCPSCRASRKAQRSAGGSGEGAGSYGGYGQSSGGYGGYAERRPREMYSAVCAECGRAAQVPFQPTGARPVYCSDCFQSKR